MPMTTTKEIEINETTTVAVVVKDGALQEAIVTSRRPVFAVGRIFGWDRVTEVHLSAGEAQRFAALVAEAGAKS